MLQRCFSQRTVTSSVGNPKGERREMMRGNRVKAIVYYQYGGPEVLRYEEIEKPAPADGEVLLKTRAASLNPYDWHFMRGEPYAVRLIAGIGKPKNERLG